ncbi:MAG: hypothetical protein LBV49_09920, partial [Azonexus sp.]|nr:hypothetical protein [Azonexus sp.]
AGWSSAVKNAQGVTMGKKGASPDENHQIEMYLVKQAVPVTPISNYIDNIRKNTIEGYKNNKAFDLVYFDAAPDKKEPRCARAHILLKKKDDGNFASGDSGKKFSEQYILSCAAQSVSANNKLSRLGVELRYYQRYHESNKDPALKEKAERLFDSVVLGQ